MADNLLNTNQHYLDGTGLSQVWAAALAAFVKQEAGKGLSTNDLTNELLKKLNDIAAGAQVNVIEGVQVNGIDIAVEGKKVNVTVPTGALAELDEVGADQLDSALAELINSCASKTYVDTEIAKKADKATTLAGYGIVDAYDKTATDEAITNAVKAAVTGVYKVKGSVAFAELNLGDTAEGDVYNITDVFATTEDFIEGAGVTYPAGTNVVAVSVSGALKWDVMAGTYDFSDFVRKDDIQSLSSEEIAAICVVS